MRCGVIATFSLFEIAVLPVFTITCLCTISLTLFSHRSQFFHCTKNQISPFFIRIKDEVKYNNIFDKTFDAHQKYVKYVTPLHIPLTRIKSEFKCINNFGPTFDARQIEIK